MPGVNNNKLRLALRWLVVLIIVIAAGVAIWAATRPKPVPVATASVDVGRVETTVANTRAGSVTACRRAKLAPPAGGRIARLNVHKGDRVKAGQVLLSLWNEDLTTREKVAREQVRTAAARERELCETAALAARDAKRSRELRLRNFVSQEAVERAEADAAAKRAGCESGATQRGEAKARVEAARADTARTILTAPFAGIVAEVNGEVGEFLTPSPPGIPTLPAIDLIDDSCIYVSAPIDEVDAAQLQVGMPGRITLDAFRGRHFDGHVRRIAPYVLAIEKQARTVEVEVEFNTPPDRLLIGYSADVEIVVVVRDNVLRIPTPALMPGNRVLVLVADGKLEERKIDIGLSNWQYTEVKAGLERGDKVVTSLEREGVKAGARATLETTPASASPTPKK